VSDTGDCVELDEPPDADPHVRWCERGRLAAAPYSIVADTGPLDACRLRLRQEIRQAGQLVV
jgi:hypothetical protein